MHTELSRLDPRRVAQICAVTIRTARGWRQRRRWPAYAERLVRLVEFGDLEILGGRSWRGWYLVDGILTGPDGEAWDTGRLGAWWIERQQIPLQRRDLERYRDGVPIIDRAELERLQRAAQAAAEAAHALGRLYPKAATAGARQDNTPPPAPALAVSG